MNRNRLIGFAVTAAALGLLVFVAYSFFEIYPATKPLPPSREARVNRYLALDRWLLGMGYNERIESSGDLSTISRAKERQIFIQASLFDWTDEAVKYLARWVLEGGRLFLVLDVDYSQGMNDEEPLRLLGQFGIKPGTEGSSSGYHQDPESPNYDRKVSFEVSGEEDALALKDQDDITRLVEVNRGGGKLIVTGRPRFLLSSNIGRAPNARLASSIFAWNHAPDNGGMRFINVSLSGDEGGWLFIRGTTKVRGLLGSLFRHGNLVVLLVSILVLLVVGFWTVIPMFGLVRGDDERPGKPLRERFLAEGRFLKRYRALGFYRDMYVREIRRRIAHNEGLSADDEIVPRLQGLLNTTGEEQDKRLLARAFRRELFSYREFPRMISIFKTILERI